MEISGSGPWVLAAAIVIATYRDLIKDLIGRVLGAASKPTQPDQVSLKSIVEEMVRALNGVPDQHIMRELSRSLDRLTDVLEHFERDQGKASEQQLTLLNKVVGLAERLDLKVDTLAKQISELEKRS